MWEGGEQAAAHGDWVRRGQVTELGAAVGTSLRKQHASSGQVAGWAGRLESERCPCCGSPPLTPATPRGLRHISPSPRGSAAATGPQSGTARWALPNQVPKAGSPCDPRALLRP